MGKVTLYRQKRNGKELAVWWIYYRLDGRSFRKSTGTTLRKEAEKTRIQIEKLLASERRKELTREFRQATLGQCKKT